MQDIGAWDVLATAFHNGDPGYGSHGDYATPDFRPAAGDLTWMDEAIQEASNSFFGMRWNPHLYKLNLA